MSYEIPQQLEYKESGLWFDLLSVSLGYVVWFAIFLASASLFRNRGLTVKILRPKTFQP